MKNTILYSFLFGFLSVGLQAQTLSEALNFSTDKLSGTARFTGMSGSFGALGGDISALKVNPAGSAIFLSNHASFSLNNRTYTNDGSYLGEFNSVRNNNIDLNQAGAVLVFKNANEEASVSKLALGFTYDKTNNYKNSFHASGTGNNTIGTYFADLANGVPLDLFTTRPDESLADLYSFLGETGFAQGGISNADLQTAFLGYQTYITESTNPENLESTGYTSAISGNSFDQNYHFISSGLNGKFSANGSLALNDRFYFGLNLNGHFINYYQTTRYLEQNSNAGSRVNEVYFRNRLETLGRGFSFQLGGIALLTDMIRVGVTWDSPTWYTIADETTQYLDTVRGNGDIAVADPRVINIYPEYNYRTPGKLTGSLGLVFGNRGLINIDYSYKDYTGMTYSSDGFDFQNQLIDEVMTATSSFRVGGEYRIKNWSLRGGYRFEQSPYENTAIQGDLTGYSIGLGYNFGMTRLDFAYDYAQQDTSANLLYTGLPNRTTLDNQQSQYVLTLSFAL